MMTARIAVATALSSAISSSVVRALNGCLAKGLICFRPKPRSLLMRNKDTARFA